MMTMKVGGGGEVKGLRVEGRKGGKGGVRTSEREKRMLAYTE